MKYLKLILVALVAIAGIALAQPARPAPRDSSHVPPQDRLTVAQNFIQRLKVAEGQLEAVKSLRSLKGDSLVVTVIGLGTLKSKMDKNAKASYLKLLEQAGKNVAAINDSITKYLKPQE